MSALFPVTRVLGLFVRLVALAAHPVERRGRIRLRDLELHALARLARVEDAGNDCEHAEERAGVDPDRRVVREVWTALLVVHRGDDARPRVVRDAVTRHVAVRAGRAVAGDVAQHDARIDLAHLVEADAPSFERAGSHRHDDRVGFAHEVEEDLDAFRLAQVERDAALAPVALPVQERDAVDDRPAHLAHVVAAGRLDLEHIGAEVGEQGTQRARPQQRGVEHTDTAKRLDEVGIGGHPPILAAASRSVRTQRSSV